MKKLFFLAPLVLLLTGCPAANQQKVAQAVNNIAIITVGLQQSEISAHQQGLIPDDDHRFIEQQLLTLGTAGKAADACIRTATDAKGDVACIDTVVATVDNINSQGGLFLKSAKAKGDFQTAMAAVKTVLLSVETVIGTKAAQ